MKIKKRKIIIGVLLVLWAINHFAMPAGEKINRFTSPDGKYILEVYQKPGSLFSFHFGHSGLKEYFVVLKKRNGWIVKKPGYWVDSIWDDLEFTEGEGSGGLQWDMKNGTVWFTHIQSLDF